ncbi:type II CAAX endopeptidase family protein [Clostridium sp.]|uniref:CPBP family intramembrane glutamic endopeptidase n=1 Tax=Clostridium sp. TaxID=1506 RepID=UPI00258757A8|nr:type II CAAX endopeptidase family protein [Clostridium sp.]MDF2504962.1 putative metal-dependent rane protease [Clostridium sp.]
MLKNIFMSRNSQVRSGWKIAIVFIFFILITSLTQIITIAIYPNSFNNYSGHIDNALNLNTPMGFITMLLQCLCMILSIFIFWKKFDKKPIKNIGLINIKNGYSDLIKGLILGGIALTIVFLILFTTGNIKPIASLNRPNFNISALTGLILFIFVGINEEMFARGYCFTVLRQSTNKWIAIIVSSIMFAVMHSLNSGISLLSYVNLFLFALLAMYMTIKSKNLWLSIGFHITWNYFEGNVFGFLVSGNEANGIFNVRNTIDNIVNGGKFGPEGGLVVTFVLCLCFLFMWKFYKAKTIN